MRLKELIRAPKEITDRGSWSSGKAMPRASFPLHGKTKLVRSVYSWKIIKFSSLGSAYRLLIFYRVDKECYYCWLAVDTGDPVTLVARYEYHATHPGWHLHACCDFKKASAGRAKGHFDRLPSSKSVHRGLEFGIANDHDAENRAIRVFRLDLKPDDASDLFR